MSYPISEILVTYWPDRVHRVVGNFTGSTAPELQAFLDANVEWLEGVPVTAADIIAKRADWEALVAGAEAERAQEKADDETVRVDPTIKSLITSRPGAIDTYIDNNVSNLAQAKDVLKILAKAVRLLGRREFTGG